jgi:hypothetical protein
MWNFDRHYNSFSILGNVRNGYGFAGCDTGDGFVPVSDGRDLPDDACEVTRTLYSNGDLGDHSFTYVTLKELLEYEHWDRQTKLRGVVSAAEYYHWRWYQKRDPYAAPDSWCGGISGPDIKLVGNSEMDVYLADYKSSPPTDSNYYTQIEWIATTRHAAEPLLLLIADLAIVEHSDPSKLRLVFGFDS